MAQEFGHLGMEPAPLDESPPPTKTITVPQSDGQIVITEGGDPIVYRVHDGEIVVAEDHVAAVLGAVQGSELKQETPAKEK